MVNALIAHMSGDLVMRARGDVLVGAPGDVDGGVLTSAFADATGLPPRGAPV